MPYRSHEEDTTLVERLGSYVAITIQNMQRHEPAKGPSDAFVYSWLRTLNLDLVPVRSFAKGWCVKFEGIAA